MVIIHSFTLSSVGIESYRETNLLTVSWEITNHTSVLNSSHNFCNIELKIVMIAFF